MTPPAVAFDPRRRTPALDGLRGVAILLVLLVHCTAIRPTDTVSRLCLGPMVLGWSGVDLFFVISGFLITSILLDTRGASGYFSIFYARRVLRIFPLYYTLLFLTLVVLPQFDHPRREAFAAIEGHEIYFWTFLANFSIAYRNGFEHGILAAAWALSIEEQFYLVWPLVVLAAGTRGLKRLCPVLITASLLCRLVLMFGFDASNVQLYVLTPCRLDGLAAGGLAATLVREGFDPARYAGRLKLVAFACCSTLLVSETAQLFLYPDSDYQYSNFACGPGFTLLAIGFAALLLLALSRQAAPRLVRAFESRWLQSFGLYSYGTYMLHGPARAIFRDLIYGPAGETGGGPLIPFPEIGGSLLLAQLAFYPPAIAISWLVGWLSWRLLEAPCLRLKRYFPYPGTRKTSGPTPGPDRPLEAAE
ncbi:MAG: acyltransferase [Planctomycetota bacterium]